MVSCVVSNCGYTMCQIMDYTDDFWWLWTAFYPIMEATAIACFCIQDFQGGWTMYGFTHIVYFSFPNSIITLLLCILYFFYTCIVINTIFTYWSMIEINRYKWTHWWTIFIGQQFQNLHRITRQYIGQWGRWTI